VIESSTSDETTLAKLAVFFGKLLKRKMKKGGQNECL